MEHRRSPLAAVPGKRGPTRRILPGDLFPFLFLILLSVLLAIAAGLLLRRASTEARDAGALAAENNLLLQEREHLMDQLIEMEMSYLALSQAHELLERAFDAEQEEIARLQAQLRRGIAPDEKERFTERISSLEQILQRYQAELETLIMDHELLRIESQGLSRGLQQAEQRNEVLEEQKAAMQQKLDKARELDVYGLNTGTYRERRRLRETDRASRVDVLEVCFMVGRNELAPAGDRRIYFRLRGPDRALVAIHETMPFSVDGEQKEYSFSSSFHYSNEELQHCVRWNELPAYLPGPYELKPFMDGKAYPSTSFELR